MELTVGRIGRPHGLRGDVTVDVRSDDPKRRFAAGVELRTDPANRGPLRVAGYRVISGVNVVRFEGCDDRNTAETLRGTLLVVDVEALPELLDDDDFYDHQLIGLQVRLAGSNAEANTESIGEVIDVLHLPAGDVLAVRTDQAPSGEVLIPFVAVIVPTVSVAGGYLVVDPPDGLFD